MDEKRTFQLLARARRRRRHRHALRAQIRAGTRDMIKNKAGEGTDFIKQRSADLKQSANQWVDKGKEAIGRQKDNISDAVEAGRQAYRDTERAPGLEFVVAFERRKRSHSQSDDVFRIVITAGVLWPASPLWCRPAWS